MSSSVRYWVARPAELWSHGRRVGKWRDGTVQVLAQLGEFSPYMTSLHGEMFPVDGLFCDWFWVFYRCLAFCCEDSGNFVHGGPLRGMKNFLTPFYPRRATKGHEEHLIFFLSAEDAEGRGELQLLLSTKGHEGPRRTATATPFVHGGPRRTTENGNCNFFLSAEDAEGRGELQLLLSTKGHEGPRRTATATPFVHGGPRRTATATSFCPRRTRRGTEKCKNLFGRGGRGELLYNLFDKALALQFAVAAEVEEEADS